MLLASFVGASALLGVLLAGIALPAVGASALVVRTGPSIVEELPANFDTVAPAEESVMLDANGGVIAKFYDKRRIVVPSDHIAEIMKKGIVAIEDKRFWEHRGVDPEGIARALVRNFTSDGGMQGASTITQQYVRNMLQERGYLEGDAELVTTATEQTTERKLREIKMALAVERRMTKDEILTGYLNIAPFGPTTYGVEAASLSYFGHSASEMSVAEAALLAGLVQSPVEYNPLTAPEAAQNRRDTVLSVMLDQGVISQAEHDEAVAIPVADMLHPVELKQGCLGAPGSMGYFCDYVLKEFLADEAYGDTEADRLHALKTGGLQIHTTIDPKAQEAAFKAVTDRVPVDDPSDVDTAIAAIEPQTGWIKAMAQNTNYGLGEGQTMANYAAGSDFQVGSTFKVFTLMEWMKEGHSGYEAVGSSNRFYPNGAFKCDGKPIVTTPWTVVDLPGKNGVMTPIQATGRSVNQAFVNMASRVDFCQIFETAARFGFTNPDGTSILPVPSNIIGSGGASPLVMANVFAALINDGKQCTPRSITAVNDRDGNIIKQVEPSCREVLDRTAAQQTRTVLKKAVQQYYGNIRLINGQQFIAKTGTTDDYANNWLVGATPQLAAGAWLGHGDTSTMPIQNITINGRYHSWGLDSQSDVGQYMWEPFMNAYLGDKQTVDIPEAFIGSQQTRSTTQQSNTSSSFSAPESSTSDR